MCGAFFRGLFFSIHHAPLRSPAPPRGSPASHRRSGRARPSSRISVGSIISVPGTGQLIVGAMEAAIDQPLGDVIDGHPARSLSGRVSMMHSCATRPLLAA